MIYPNQFPTNNENQYERETYLALSKLMRPEMDGKDEFDVFCFRKFSGEISGEELEYEIDFIVADIRNKRLKGLLIVEVKGHTLQYDGKSSIWKQDGKPMETSPTTQATRNMRSLLKRYNFLEKDVPMGWAVWFPRMVNPGLNYLPPELSEEKFFDKICLTYTKEKIVAYFESLYLQWPHKNGCELDVYFRLKEPLIRSLGYSLPLHKKIEAAETRFLEMTNRQLELLRIIGSNKDIIISGPAGSGKTIMATTIARELSETQKKVLILTFNRILANNIRYGLGNPENPEVSTYHSLARKYIDLKDKQWWTENSKNENFWDLEVPLKFLEALKNVDPIYDYIIIDEAQDLQELWYENLNALIKPEGGFYIFIDEDQDIFHSFRSIALNRKLFTFPLEENCRNTIKIINQLKTYIKKEIKYKNDSVEGDDIKIIEYKNDIEQMNHIKNEWLRLVNEDKISPDRILLIMNTDKRQSCLSNTKKFGKFQIESLPGRTGQLQNNKVNYSSIRSFKGLEADIVFIIDTDKVIKPNYKILYTQASRAKHLLYITFHKN
jgi:hypothetical protein